MRIVWMLIFPILLFSTQLKEILMGVDSSLLIRSSDLKTNALRKVVQMTKAKSYPNVDLVFSAIRLKDTPSSIFNLPNFAPIDLAIGTKYNLSGAIEFAYPIFTGYKIENSIKKAELQVVRSKLKTKNFKRELYLKSIDLYSNLYAINRAIKATKEAIKALDLSFKKAKQLYNNELINIVEVYNIKAKKYDTIAKLQTLKAEKKGVENELFYISGVRLEDPISLSGLLKVEDKKSVVKKALKNREDIKILKKELEIEDSDIKLAKSRYYPNVSLVGAIKREGDNFKLNGNGFGNADKSYIGVNLKWNLFDGYAKTRGVEAAILKKEATKLFLDDYVKKVITEIENSFLTLNSLKAKLQAAKEELKAQNEYYKLVKERFENALSSADKLSRAIASLSQAKAKFEKYKAKIFYQKYKILLQTGLDNIKER